MMSSVSSTTPTDSSNNIGLENQLTSHNLVAIEKTHIDLTEDNSPTNFQTSTSENPIINSPLQLPVVFYQTTPKLPFNTINKTNNSNVLVNSMPQLRFTPIAPAPPKVVTSPEDATPVSHVKLIPPNVPPAVSSLSVPNSNVLLSGNSVKPQQIVLQKPSNNLQLPKISGAYITLLKPLTKVENQLQNAGSKNIIINSPSTTGQKIVIAPMPKVTSSRLPATATTNSVQSKIAIKPLSHLTSSKPNLEVLNFKIEDGQLVSNNTPITILCDSRDRTPNEDKLHCDEIIDLDSPEKEDDDVKIIETNRETKMFSEFPKQPKIGISILKKNYQLPDGRRNSLPTVISSVSDFISDTSSHVDVTKPSTGTTETILLSDPNRSLKISQKKHSRRKSAFSNVKTDDSIQFFDTVTMNIKKSLENTNVCLTRIDDSDVSKTIPKSEPDFVEIKIIKDDQSVPVPVKSTFTKTEIKVENDSNDVDLHLKNLLKWNGRVGNLPGSGISFIINEYGILEYVTKEDIQKINKMVKLKKEEINNELKCLECGCFGLPSDFVSSKYCSIDCREVNQKKNTSKDDHRYKRKRKSHKQDNRSDKDSISDDSSNENSQDKSSPPWISGKKVFSWPKYLNHVNAIAAPVKLFKDPFPYNRNGFRPGMKLEGIDPLHPSYFCVLSVVEIRGYRIRLHFDGYSSNYDFWSNADSMDIFPVGWCEKHGHTLHPPPGYNQDSFNWFQYLKQTGTTAAPRHLFLNKGSSVCPNGFRVGQKLEAVDRKNTSLICVATITDAMDNRILIHFDGWDDIYDYWVDPSSPYIHPVGWSDQYGHRLTPPSDYPNPKEFTWNNYLKETNSSAAPVRAFKQRPPCGFKKGMRLESVDKRVPRYIRVATVAEVKGHQMKIQFDGWVDKYNYWVEDDSMDIHPVGWCQKTGHPLEAPLTPDDVYDFLDCPTIGCKGFGHSAGSKYTTHATVKDCPYTDENLSLEKTLPDRLLPDLEIAAIVPVSREPKDKVKGKITRTKCLQRELKADPDYKLYPEKKKKSKPIKKIKLEHEDSTEESNVDNIYDLLLEWQKMPAEKETWPKHSEFLNVYTEYQKRPISWSPSEVAQFIETLPTGRNYADVFEKNDIDGEALLLLSQNDIIDLLNIKVGPAIKLYNSIVLLRRNVAKRFS